jgi:polyisoprenoid-binding protein YceI
MQRPRQERNAVGRPLAAALCVLLSAPAGGDPRLYTVDPTQSRADFRVRYLGLLPVSGRFGSVAGTVLFDPDHWEQLSVTIHIPVAGLAARPEFLRQQLLSSRFFEVARYPSIEFSGERALKTGPGSGDAWGRLTLHGTTRAVVLAVRAAPRGEAIEFDATCTLHRSAFGLVGLLAVASDEVRLLLHLRAVTPDRAPQ